MLEIGYVLDGKYKILNVVGRGGMSVVYLAMNEKANKQWAVKEVRKDGVKDFEVVKQSLIAEIDMLKRLDHPSLPSIVDVIEEEDRFLIVMDYVQGNALSVALEEYGAQPQELVIEWAKQLCDVLGYLHTRQPAIIYRDMKPANIMLKPDGNVTLIDFGTAREFKERNVADTTCLGTIGYAAPEQFGGMGQTDGRTDIYCLGTTLYHLVTGMNPCEPPYEIRPIRQINPALSSGLEKIIMKCTRPNPADRYQNAAELMYDLEHYEEIDELYIKKQKRKIGIFAAAIIASVSCFVLSGINYFIAESKMKDNYMAIINDADAATDSKMKIDLYTEAMAIDPGRTTAYDRILGQILDGEIDRDELRIINSWSSLQNRKGTFNNDIGYYPINELKKANKEYYDDLCFEIGRNIISYYEGKTDFDKYDYAYNWFEKVKDDERAKKYYLIVSNKKKVNKLQKGKSIDDSIKAYKALWKSIGELEKDAKQEKESKDYKLLTYINILEFVSNPEPYIDSGVCDKTQMKELLIDIRNELKQMDSKQCQEKIESLDLNGRIESILKKMDSYKKAEE